MTLQLTVPKLACSACVNTVTKAVKTVDPNAKVQADPKTKLVLVETQADQTAIKQAIAQAGYPAAAPA
jgi:copper chaperone